MWFLIWMTAFRRGVHPNEPWGDSLRWSVKRLLQFLALAAVFSIALFTYITWHAAQKDPAAYVCSLQVFCHLRF